MKPPGRTHGTAGSSRGEDEGDDGDDQLRAMRSVWLEMRDEDPPERGLTELLAAARGKAASLQPAPSRWRRLASLLRRPPVLAMATALVVLGGVALMARRTSGVIGSEERMVTAPAPTVAVAPEAMGWGARSDAQAVRAAPERAAVGAASSTVASGGAPAGGAGPRVTPGPDAASAAEAPERSERVTRSSGGEASEPRPPVVSKPAPATPPARKDRLRSAPGGRSPSKLTADDDGLRATPDAVPPGAPASNAGETQRPPGAEAVAALRGQCEAAASRGDCTAVRRLVERISEVAPGDAVQIAKHAGVATCLTKQALPAK